MFPCRIWFQLCNKMYTLEGRLRLFPLCLTGNVREKMLSLLKIGFFNNAPDIPKEKQLWKLKFARRKKNIHIKRGKEFSESSTDE